MADAETRDGWVSCGVCGVSVPSGLTRESEWFGREKIRCVTCDGSLRALSSRGVEDVDEALLVDVSKSTRKRMTEKMSSTDTLNPVQMVVEAYLKAASHAEPPAEPDDTE